MSDKMVVEIFKDEEWVESNFQSLVIGSKFRIRDPHTKEIFVGDNNHTEFIVTSKPYVNKDGIGTVDIRPTWKYAGAKICNKTNEEV